MGLCLSFFFLPFQFSPFFEHFGENLLMSSKRLLLIVHTVNAFEPFRPRLIFFIRVSTNYQPPRTSQSFNLSRSLIRALIFKQHLSRTPQLLHVRHPWNFIQQRCFVHLPLSITIHPNRRGLRAPRSSIQRPSSLSDNSSWANRESIALWSSSCRRFDYTYQPNTS